MFLGLDFLSIFCIVFSSIFDQKWVQFYRPGLPFFAAIFDTFSKGGPKDARGPFLNDF